MSELCRVCLEVAEVEAYSISDCILGLNEPIYKILNVLGDLNEDFCIGSDDGFPQKICVACSNKVKVATEFILADATFDSYETCTDDTDSNSDESCDNSSELPFKIKFESEDADNEELKDISIVTKSKSLKKMSKMNTASQKAGGDKAYCEICDYTYSSIQELRRHKDRIHASHKPFKCDVKNCDREFSKEYLIRKHKRESHHAALSAQNQVFTLLGKPEDVTCCCMCDFQIQTHEELERHVKEQHPSPQAKKYPGECTFECQYCLKRFQKKSSFYLHFADKEFEEDVTKRKQKIKRKIPCICHTCGKTFPGRNNLYLHEQRVHPTATPFVCSIEKCTAKFSLRSALDYHLKEVHATEKKFVCHICAASFTRNKYLNTHLLVHEKGKDIKCPKCRLYFKTEADMEKHAKNHNKNMLKKDKQSDKVMTRDYKCSQCERTFLREGHLQLHAKACSKKLALPINEIAQTIKDEVVTSPEASMCQ